MVPDAEVLKVVTEILDDLDVGDYAIKLNHRGLLDATLEIAGEATSSSWGWTRARFCAWRFCSLALIAGGPRRPKLLRNPHLPKFSTSNHDLPNP